MTKGKPQYRSDAETRKLMDAAVRRALNTPPKPLKEMKKERRQVKAAASSQKP